MTNYADKNGLEFRIGFYEYRGHNSQWYGVKINMTGHANFRGSVTGVTIKANPKLGEYYGKIGVSVTLRLGDLIRITFEGKPVKTNKIDNVFNFNFKD